jgi:hypothetical protein
MLVISASAYEFENPSTEESVEISIAKVGQPSADVHGFVAAAVDVASTSRLEQPSPFQEHFGYGLVREYLAKFAHFQVPKPCTWPTYVLVDGPDEWHIVMCAPEHFISYRWETSA